MDSRLSTMAKIWSMVDQKVVIDRARDRIAIEEYCRPT